MLLFTHQPMKSDVLDRWSVEMIVSVSDFLSNKTKKQKTILLLFYFFLVLLAGLALFFEGIRRVCLGLLLCRLLR